MRFFSGLKTIVCIFLVVYLMVGVTGGFAHCPLEASHRLTAIRAVPMMEPSNRTVVAAGFLPQKKDTGNKSLCQTLPPAFKETATLNSLDASSPLSTPPLLSELAYATLLATAQAPPGFAAAPPPQIHPLLAHIRTVVLLA
jgi:hypothetical protein